MKKLLTLLFAFALVLRPEALGLQRLRPQANAADNGVRVGAVAGSHGPKLRCVL